MSEYGDDFVVLTDEDGVEQEFEHLDTLEHNGTTYMAFIPADMADDEEAEVVILKLLNEGEDEEVLASIEDEAEMEEIFNLFMERMEEADYEEDEEDEDEEEA